VQCNIVSIRFRTDGIPTNDVQRRKHLPDWSIQLGQDIPHAPTLLLPVGQEFGIERKLPHLTTPPHRDVFDTIASAMNELEGVDDRNFTVGLGAKESADHWSSSAPEVTILG
jgi:hypothetical protein